MRPRLAEADEGHVLAHFWGRERIVRRRGEALQPEREGVAVLGQIRRTIGEYPPDTSFRGSPGKGARLRDVRPARIALHPAAAIPAPAAAPNLARTLTAAPLYAGVSRDAGPHLTYSALHGQVKFVSLSLRCATESP